MLLSHDRPPHEVLAPREQDQAEQFARQFAGMAREPFDVDDGRRAFADLIAALPSLLPMLHRKVLVEFITAGDGITRLRHPEIADLPAVRWKAQNLDRLRRRGAKKHAAQIELLQSVLADLASA